MRIVVTGKAGQVVRSLVERGTLAGYDIICVGRPNLDLASDGGCVLPALEEARPELIVSAAAYTAVDRAESEPELAFAINEGGAGAVATAACSLDVPLIHLSTDYVFDGTKSEPYLETDGTHPTGIYGASKLAGERAVQAAHANAAILRTAWVYSPFGSNFVKTMLQVARERDEISVVDDQRGNPTSALDIADTILAVATDMVGSQDPGMRGIFHASGSGEASWSEFAQAVFVASSQVGGPTACVKPISTADYPTLAKRPSNSLLATEKLAAVYGLRMPEWRASVPQIVTRIVRGDL